MPVSCGRWKTRICQNTVWRYGAGFLWDWRKETEVWSTKVEEKAENSGILQRDFRKAKEEVSAEVSIPSHSCLWERNREYQR